MRLVDADALAKKAENLNKKERRFVQVILSVCPTIEAEPVRHGRWISHEGYDECGLCHGKSIFSYNYCQNCGAKMDLE